MTNTNRKKLIIVEMNEVPFRILDAYVKRHPRSHIAALMSKSRQFDAICEDQTELDPWISWASLHRGVNDQTHGVLHLGQSVRAINARFPPIWELLSKNGIRCGIMGSLHSSERPPNLDAYDFYIPDFFSSDSFAHPADMEAFQRFNLAMTRGSTRNVARGLPIAESTQFLRHYVTSGMSASTVRATLSELTGEIRKPHLKCRRRSIQPLISFDYFESLLCRHQPDFATFYTNHVAAAMHRYWEAAFPDDVPDGAMPQEWRRKYAGEIDYAMGVLDSIVGRLLKLSHRYGYVLALCGSLGQAAVHTQTASGFVSLIDLHKFMSQLGLSPSEWHARSAMAPCVSVEVADEKAEHLEKMLMQIGHAESLMLPSDRELKPLSFARSGNSFHIYVYFHDFTGETLARIGDRQLSFEDLGWGWIKHEDDVECSARHTPFGALVTYDPNVSRHSRKRDTVTILDIAPSVLGFFGIEPPSYMNPINKGLIDLSAGLERSFEYQGGGTELPVVLQSPDRLHEVSREKETAEAV